jgi:two-component system, sensor histidine kinase PdtaS
VVGGEIALGSREATVFALVLNELVNNAIYHGFTDMEEGHITITASAEGTMITVVVKDDGKGLPDGFDFHKHAGLGLQIVETLVGTELQGHFSLASLGGTVATISFEQNSS